MIIKPQTPVQSNNQNVQGVNFTNKPVSSQASASAVQSAAPASQVPKTVAPATNSARTTASVATTPQSQAIVKTTSSADTSVPEKNVTSNAPTSQAVYSAVSSQASTPVSASQSVSNYQNANSDVRPNSKDTLGNTSASNHGSSSINKTSSSSNMLSQSTSNSASQIANSNSASMASSMSASDNTLQAKPQEYAAVPNLNLATRSVPSRSLGIDVSAYQGTDLTQYAKDGAKYAIVKLSEGTSYYNPNAAGQIKSAEQNGMLAMGYHFARFGASTSQADAEAKHAIANAEAYGLPKGSYLACDYEEGCGAGSNAEANTAAVLQFMKDVKNAGYIPLLYSGQYFMKSKLNLSEIGKAFGQCLWVAKYPTTAAVSGPDFDYFPSMDNVLIWQYSDNWHGVDGDVTVGPLVNGQSTGGTGNVNTGNTTPSSSSSSNTSNEPTWTDNLGDVWHKEKGIFTVGDTPLHLRWGATTSSTIITTLQPGQQVEYDAWMNDGTYTWIRQPRGNGTYGYVAVRDKDGAFGTFSDVPGSNNSSNANKPSNSQASNSKPSNSQNNNSKPANNSNPDANYTGQKQVNGKWQYWQNGKPVKNTYEWIPSENKETYYDNNGNMVYGSQNINGHNQYFDPVTGAQVKNNFVTNDGKSYYYDQNGNMVYGEQHVWDANRYFDPKTGVEAKNQYVWLPDKNEEVYYGPDGAMVYGWQTIDGQKRYFDPKTGAQAKSCTLNIDGQNWSFDGQGNPTLVSPSSNSTNNTSSDTNGTSSSPSNSVSVGGNSQSNGNPSASVQSPNTDSSSTNTTNSGSNSNPISSNETDTGINNSTSNSDVPSSSDSMNNDNPSTSSSSNNNVDGKQSTSDSNASSQHSADSTKSNVSNNDTQKKPATTVNGNTSATSQKKPAVSVSPTTNSVDEKHNTSEDQNKKSNEILTDSSVQSNGISEDASKQLQLQHQNVNANKNESSYETKALESSINQLALRKQYYSTVGNQTADVSNANIEGNISHENAYSNIQNENTSKDVSTSSALDTSSNSSKTTYSQSAVQNVSNHGNDMPNTGVDDGMLIALTLTTVGIAMGEFLKKEKN